MARTDIDPQTIQDVYRRYSFDDLVVSVAGRQLDVSAGRVDYNYDELTLDFADNARYPQEVIGVPYQLPHTWVKGTWLHAHIHWFQGGADVPNWMIAYRKIRNGEAVPSTWTLAKYDNHAYTYSSGTILQISSFPEIDLGDMSWSDSVDIKLYRDSANASTLFAGADPLTGDALVKFFDVHIPIRGRGTLGEWSDG